MLLVRVPKAQMILQAQVEEERKNLKDGRRNGTVLCALVLVLKALQKDVAKTCAIAMSKLLHGNVHYPR